MGFFVGFLIFCFFLLVFLLLTNKYKNPYKLIMIFGKKGSGKSTTLTKFAITHKNKGWTVYSTEIIPDTYYIAPENIGFYQLEDFNYKEFDINAFHGIKRIFMAAKNYLFPVRPKILLLVDEVGMIWDNRNFKGFKPEVRNFFKLQRHYHCKIVLFSQTFDIDKKLRDLTDSMYLQKNLFRVFTYGKKIKKSITINNNTEDGGKLDESFEFEPFLAFPFGSRTLTFIPKWSKYFKSFDCPKLQSVNYEFTDYSCCSVGEISALQKGESE